MRKTHFKVICIILGVLLLFSGCTGKSPKAKTDQTGKTKTIENTINKTIKGEFQTYYEMSDGTFKTDQYIYKYRLEITGTMNNAAKESTFVYLSNIKNISFDQAWKAAGFSSSMEDYFSPETAILVEMK